MCHQGNQEVRGSQLGNQHHLWERGSCRWKGRRSASLYVGEREHMHSLVWDKQISWGPAISVAGLLGQQHFVSLNTPTATSSATFMSASCKNDLNHNPTVQLSFLSLHITVCEIIFPSKMSNLPLIQYILAWQRRAMTHCWSHLVNTVHTLNIASEFSSDFLIGRS